MILLIAGSSLATFCQASGLLLRFLDQLLAKHAFIMQPHNRQNLASSRLGDTAREARPGGMKAVTFPQYERHQQEGTPASITAEVVSRSCEIR